MLIGKIGKAVKQRAKQVDRHSGYDTQRWRVERKQHLSDNPLCVECIKIDIATPATVLDHIKNVASYPTMERDKAFWDKKNRQGLCKSCHDIKSAKEKVK